MNNPSAALSHWQALHAQSIAMLNLAHSGQWDALIEQEMHYVQLWKRFLKRPSCHALRLRLSKRVRCWK